MNREAMVRLLSPLAACALLLSGCGQSGQPASDSPIGEPPLTGASIGGDFELIDKHGATVRWSDFAGQYRIVYFGFTYCPDICPTDMGRLIRGLRAFEQQQPGLAAQIQPIFISIDPARDTPEAVGQFAAAFSDKVIGLTGSEDQVKQAADAFRVYYAKGEEFEGGYLMNHSAISYLFGPAGEPLATLPTDQGHEAVADELAKWVR